MLGLANEELVKEAFNSLGAQILTLANMEKEDMKNLTQNFIELKNKVDTKNPEIALMFSEIEKLRKEFDNFKTAVSYLDRELRELNKKKSFQEEIDSEIITPTEMPKMENATQIILEKIQRGDMSTEGVPERLVGYCISCEKEMVIKNPEIRQALEGGKMTTGPCIKCGRTLFKIH